MLSFQLFMIFFAVLEAPSSLCFYADPTKDTSCVIRLLSGADGIAETSYRGHRPCVINKPEQQPASVFLYFSVSPERPLDKGKSAYVEVVYYDNKPDIPLTLEYDSTSGDSLTDIYQFSDDQWGGGRFGRKSWEKAVFLIQKPGFTGRQNLGADFRIGGGDLIISQITLSPEPPPDINRLKKGTIPTLLSKTHIGAGRKFIIGGFDIPDEASLSRQINALKNAIPILKAMGLTSHESYVRWNLCEPAPGHYDWKLYDAYTEVYKEAGIKWVPFLIIGSAYSLPNWFYNGPTSQGYVCLEHNEESDIESLWNPVLRAHVQRFIQAFCEHYRDTGLIESILLGITGNYGEAIYPASGNDWTANTHGEYHTHAGLWAGDPYARCDWVKYLTRKYEGIEALNSAWGTSFTCFNEIQPFQRNEAPNNRAWLDFGEWYIGAMNEYTRFWVETTRRHFTGRIELCTGGHAPLEHGANFADQCKIAAAYGAGVRITNECSDYRVNYSLTRWIASAGRQYGAYYSFEPAGTVNENGIVARIYNAATSGAEGIHFYYPNLFQNERARNNFIRYAPVFRKYQPITEIAAYYPQTHIMLHGNHFLQYVQPLRDYFDFSYCSDNEIADGGLEQFKVLLLLWGHTAEEETWERIGEWIGRGGILVYALDNGPLQTVEGNTEIVESLLLKQMSSGTGKIFEFTGYGTGQAFRRYISNTLGELKDLSEITRYMIKMDGQEDNVFSSVIGVKQLLWLNMTNCIQQRGRITIPPFGISKESVLPNRR